MKNCEAGCSLAHCLKFTLTPKKLESTKSKLVVQELCIESETGMKNNSIFYHTFFSCVPVGGKYQSLVTLFCTFLSLCLICKHFVKMYILGKLFLYVIGMLYNALMFKLSLLGFLFVWFFNCLVVIAQPDKCIGINKFRLNSSLCLWYLQN